MFAETSEYDRLMRICEAEGISIELMMQSRELHEHFAAHPELKAKYEPRVMSGELTIAAVLAEITRP